MTAIQRSQQQEFETSPTKPNISAPSKKKELYLLTDKDFPKKLILNLLSLTLLATITLSSPLTIQTPAINLYHSLTDYMLTVAHRNAWWFLLATLSSSCCVIQLLLNALSVGCAGFNTVLGPLRPTFLAIGILSQGLSWYVMLRVTRSPNWAVALTSSVLTVVLSLLPEILAWNTRRRNVVRKKVEEGMGGKGLSTDNDTVQVVFDMGTSVGCAACVTNISGLLDGIATVAGYDVSVDDNRLRIRCEKGTDPAMILDKLKDGGYSMKEE